MPEEPQFDDMRPGPGRPRKIARPPTERTLAKIAAHEAALAAFTEQDPIVAASRAGAPPAETLYAVQEAIAREAAGLLWDRNHTPPGRREAVRLSTRRLAALREMARVTLEIRHLTAGTASPAQLSGVLDGLLDAVDDVARSLFDQSTADRLAERFRNTCTVAAIHDFLGDLTLAPAKP